MLLLLVASPAFAQQPTLRVDIRGTPSGWSSAAHGVDYWRGEWVPMTYITTSGGYRQYSAPVPAGHNFASRLWVRLAGVSHHYQQAPYLQDALAGGVGAGAFTQVLITTSTGIVTQTNGHVSTFVGNQANPPELHSCVPTDPDYDPRLCDNDGDGIVDVCDPDSAYDPNLCDTDYDGVVDSCDPSSESYSPQTCDCDSDGICVTCDEDTPWYDPCICLNCPCGGPLVAPWGKPPTSPGNPALPGVTPIGDELNPAIGSTYQCFSQAPPIDCTGPDCPPDPDDPEDPDPPGGGGTPPPGSGPGPPPGPPGGWTPPGGGGGGTPPPVTPPVTPPPGPPPPPPPSDLCCVAICWRLDDIRAATWSTWVEAYRMQMAFNYWVDSSWLEFFEQFSQFGQQFQWYANSSLGYLYQLASAIGPIQADVGAMRDSMTVATSRLGQIQGDTEAMRVDLAAVRALLESWIEDPELPPPPDLPVNTGIPIEPADATAVAGVYAPYMSSVVADIPLPTTPTDAPVWTFEVAEWIPPTFGTAPIPDLVVDWSFWAPFRPLAALLVMFSVFLWSAAHIYSCFEKS
jgi:hypothetical protein